MPVMPDLSSAKYLANLAKYLANLANFFLQLSKEKKHEINVTRPILVSLLVQLVRFIAETCFRKKFKI